MSESATLTDTHTTAALVDRAQAHLLNTYGERNLALVRGKGAHVWDAEGREYLDFFAGIAVTNLGHAHPAVTKAITDQAVRLVHCSNLYLIENQIELARLLSENTFADKWFFCNSGAEANEAAIKIARRYWAQQGTPKPNIVTMENSFHGRTMATVSATAQPKYHAGFEPMLEGFLYVPFDDIAALDRALTDSVGAVLLEPVQGEGGVRCPGESYLAEVRRLCDERGVLLMLDEVQCGMGRTGRLFAHEHAGITPDVMTISKALGNGVPVGAMGCTDRVASGFEAGAHGSTFGGNPLSTAAALATLSTLLESGLIEDTARKGAYCMAGLDALRGKHPSIVDVRGAGLMIGVELDAPIGGLLTRMRNAGVICGPAGPNVVRFLPPLIVSRGDIDRVIHAFDEALRAA